MGKSSFVSSFVFAIGKRKSPLRGVKLQENKRKKTKNFVNLNINKKILK
jgi:hypothetical protein